MSAAPPASFLAAQAAFRAGDFLTAARQFLETYAADPQPDLLYNAAQSFARARRVIDAAAQYRRYLRLSLPSSPARPRALAALRDAAPGQLAELGDEFFDAKRYPDAREAWAAWRTTGLAKDPRPLSAQRARTAEAALANGRAAEAAEAFAALYAATGSAEMVYQRGRALEASGDRRGALAAYAAFRRLDGAGALRGAASARIAVLSPAAA